MMIMQELSFLNLANIFNMKTNILAISVLLIIMSCKEKFKNPYYELLNENFLQIVDTIAYRTGRLIQIPNDTSSEFQLRNLCIEVDTIIDMPTEISLSIQSALRNEKLTDFETLFLGGAEFKIDKLELTKLKKIGRFNLVTVGDLKGNQCSKIAGKIKFYSPFVSTKKVIIPLTISESSKAGYTKAYLFSNQNGKWKNIKVLEIERW
jgi:hypothetical protein